MRQTRRNFAKTALSGLFAAALLPKAAGAQAAQLSRAAPNRRQGKAAAKPQKLIIAHRGASGYLPEHTLEAKAMAYAQGADYLEQDLVMTKDNQLIVLHDHYLDRVSDVAERFPRRARADGRYYALDFTLAEVKELNFSEGFEIKNGEKIQSYPKRFPMGKSVFRIHSFAEELEFIQGLNYSTGRDVGIYPEIKAPWFHRQAGKDIAAAALEVLKRYGYRQKSDKIFLQCFDPHELQRLKTELLPKFGMDLPLVQLIAYTDWEETQEQKPDGAWQNYSYDWMFAPGAMEKIAVYADGIGPDYHMLVEQGSARGAVKITHMAQEAQQSGMVVHPYTIRADSLPDYAANAQELFDIVYQQAGADGAFTDFPDLAAEFLRARGEHG